MISGLRVEKFELYSGLGFRPKGKSRGSVSEDHVKKAAMTIFDGLSIFSQKITTLSLIFQIDDVLC